MGPDARTVPVEPLIQRGAARPGFAAILFDFDGVIADSEVPANHALAASLTAIGLPTSYEDSIARYCGHNWQETQRRIEALLGAPLPPDFRAAHRVRARALMADQLAPVPGVADFLAATRTLPRAIASSSHADYIGWALDRFGLRDHFAGHIYSADGWDRGKPHPDIYLAAAAGLGVDPATCLAIEDSPVGASAALAAGCYTIGLLAAGHIHAPDAHREKLQAAGVHAIVTSYDELVALLGEVVQPIG